MDFIILDFEADHNVPILLVRPFMAIGRTLIDMEKGELTMRVNDDQVTFSILKTKKFKDLTEEYLASSDDTKGTKEAGDPPALPQH